jgi:transcriptional regulator with GAF, ATPase, and Fis domain
LATLRVRTPDGADRTVPLARRITTLGRGADNDIVLDDASLPDTALHVHYDGHTWEAACHGGAEMLVNGRRRVTARLADADRVRLGGTELAFSVADAAPTPPPSKDAERVTAMRSLVRFSERLLAASDLDRALDELLDALLEVTHAEKGFVILLEDGRTTVKASRNVARDAIAGAVERVSDSIVQRVLETRKPIVVADALHDAAWSSSSSVVNLKLCSIMCAPLMRRGEPFGAIYLGNDSVVSLFGEKDLEALTVLAAQASLLVENVQMLDGLRRENEALRDAVAERQFGDLIGSGPSMHEVFRRIERVAPTDVSVLVTGETGTGKELVAREIHRRSLRAQGPFIAVNCGAIPEALLESELFGHVRGAFTGAVANRDGKFQAADGGTLFLDEIGDMPLQLQVKLLRALQEHAVTRVGQARSELVDIRVVAASNRILEEEIAAGRFREDLYYRLDVVSIPLPPLRERGEDVVVIARWFLQRFAREMSSRARSFSAAAVAALRRHAWPGNVRELENRVRKAVVLADQAVVGPEDLGLGPESFEPILPLSQAKEDFQKRYINEVLARNGGNRTKTAKDLGVDPRTVFRHLEAERRERGEPVGDAAAEES